MANWKELIRESIFEVTANTNSGLHEPWFCGNEWTYVKECLDSGWVSSVGKFVDTFEQKLANFTMANHSVVVVNGTAALHSCLQLVGVHQDDEVLVPSLTFVATANAVAYLKATPNFYDCDLQHFGVDIDKLKDYLHAIADVRDGVCFNKHTNRPIRALIVMHTFGHPVDLDAVKAICEDYKISLIEDAAESLGSYYKGKHTGAIGTIGTLSFNGNKIVTTGGGGAIVTNDEKLAKRAKHLTTTAKVPHEYEYVHDEIGFNFRLPNLNAALGVAQLEKIDTFLHNKRALADRYNTAFAKYEEIRFLTEPEYAKSNYWLNAIVLNKSLEEKRDEIIQGLIADGFHVRPVWTPMHKLSAFKDCPKMNLEQAEQAERSVINLPSSAFLVKA